MSLEVIVYILTALAVVVVVLTRLRLRREKGAGSVSVGAGFLNVHTVAGTVATVLWLLFLVSPEDSPFGSEIVGIIALAFWWITTIAGLLILVRWMPSRGRHAQTAREDTWSEGPGLSILAHVGMLAGVCVFTFAYLTAKV